MSKKGSKRVAFLFKEGHQKSAQQLGNKGAGLASLSGLGIPVPPGFTITTAVARAYAQHGKLPGRIHRQLEWSIRSLEQQTGKLFGNAGNPLLVSVRSGAAVSMPGMMDTVLNLGLTPAITRGLAKKQGQRFAWDSYRRFLIMFGKTVLGVAEAKFHAVQAFVKARRGIADDGYLDGDALQEICNRFRRLIEDETGQPVSDEPRQQLKLAVIAVLDSWNSERARAYRQLHGIPSGMGTAVNVQAMVFGNLDDSSGTGVVFSCNVTSGEPGLWGEYLACAQGEDVVSGQTTPPPVALLALSQPMLWRQLCCFVEQLAVHRSEPVDVEFTVESGRLFILQVRAAKLSPQAAIYQLVHKVWKKELSKHEAVQMVSASELKQLRPRLERRNSDAALMIARGLAASPGTASGRVVLTSAAAVEAAARGQKVILVRHDTNPDDLPGMLAAQAIVTSNGGATSHAAVVARGLAKPAVVACGPLPLFEGDTITVDGDSGMVLEGTIAANEPNLSKEVQLFLRWTRGKYPAPRMVFDNVSKELDASLLLRSFYMTEAIARAAAGSQLALEANRLRLRVHVAAAEHIAVYFVLAVCGELDHASSNDDCKALLLLREAFGLRLRMLYRNPAALSTPFTLLKKLDLEQVVRFLDLASTAFEQGVWSTCYGGKPWARIASAARSFLAGELNHSLFADHAFDLQHNTGTVFGKHPMLARCSKLAILLEVKKHTSDVNKLAQEMLYTPGRIPHQHEIEDLYHKGCRLRIW